MSSQPLPPNPRTFGLFFCVLFAGYGVLKLQRAEAAVMIAVGVLLGTLAIFKPSFLQKPNLLWHQFGLFVQRIVSPIFMGIFFFLFFSPLAILLRFFGSKFLDLKIDSDRKTYWIARDPSGQTPESLRKQF